MRGAHLLRSIWGNVWRYPTVDVFQGVRTFYFVAATPPSRFPKIFDQVENTI
jgi:hypothetical protein